jgi:uncharacterized protein (TIGR00159 family)
MPSALVVVIREMLNWRVILDILLIGTALFIIYRTLRRLGTWRILAGLLIAIILFIVSRVLDFKGIVWIYSNLSQVAVIALIVIFQPELRKMFERFASLGRKRTPSEGHDFLHLLSDAVFTLAEQRRGAILVFPGREPTTEWLSGGTPLRADPSSSLIMSIFDPHSPGHDGAMVIENGRLSSFGVRLPLSGAKTLSEEFGTRHHAAMGLSEVSDALAVAISEERGTVTAFYGGRMKRIRERNALSSQIMSHWQNTASNPFLALKGGKKRTLVSELGFSLVLAFLFWFSVIFAQTEMLERVLSVPIEYVATPPDIALVGNKPTEVKLHLAGPKSDLDFISLSHPAVRIDLSKVGAGEQEFVVTDKDLSLPRNVSLLGAEPSAFVLTFGLIQEREVAVKPQFVGKLPDGLEITTVEINPSTVRILSPEDEDEKKEATLMTTPIYLESIKNSTRLFCKIVAPPNAQPAGRRWPDVEVTITVVNREGGTP